MIYDHHRGALQSNQQNMHDTAYCVMTIIVSKVQKTKKKYKKTKKRNKKTKKQYRMYFRLVEYKVKWQEVHWRL